jgi:steroid delta-isomerase-like uncharacterized protein
MSAEVNKALVREGVQEVWNKGNLESVGRYYADDYVDRTPLPGQAEGLEGYVQTVAMIRNAFPDPQLALEDVVAEEDKVAFRYTMSGTHRGDFMGISLTGRAFSVAGMIFTRIVGGRFTKGRKEVNRR